jgi:hypothetical protein
VELVTLSGESGSSVFFRRECCLWIAPPKTLAISEIFARLSSFVALGLAFLAAVLLFSSLVLAFRPLVSVAFSFS